MKALSKQISYENQCIIIGVDKYRENRDAIKLLKPEKKLIFELVSVLTKNIKESQASCKINKPGRPLKCSPILMSLEAEEIAAIASHSIIFWCILSNKKVTALSKRIGDAVQLEIHSKEFLKKYSEKKLEDIINKNKLWQKLKALKIEVGQNSSDWTDTEKIRFGTHIIDLTISSCNFFKIDFEIINRVKTKVIDFSDKIYKDIENQHIKFETIRSPIFRPMICRPLEWTTINDGGYISTSCTLVKNIKKEHGRLLEKSNLNLIYKSLNLIQNTAWNINENVLNTILDWNRLVSFKSVYMPKICRVFFC